MASITSRRKRNGSIVWDAQVRVVGYPARSRTLPTKIAAKLWASKIENMVRSASGYAAPSTITLNGVRRPVLPKGHLRFLSDEEITALLDSCRVSENTDLFAFTLMAITTGARRGELRVLEWQNVDVERKWAVFPVTKNGDARGVPLAQPTLEALLALQRAGPYVFPTDPRRRSGRPPGRRRRC